MIITVFTWLWHTSGGHEAVLYAARLFGFAVVVVVLGGLACAAIGRAVRRRGTHYERYIAEARAEAAARATVLPRPTSIGEEVRRG